MRKGVLLFAAIAFALTGGTIYFVNKWMKQERSRMAESAKTKSVPKDAGVFVLVAAKNLPTGHIVVVSDLRWQSWPDKAVPSQYIVRKQTSGTDIPAPYVGTVVRRGLIAGTPITGEALIKLGDRGFLAAVLKPGQRAISIRIDESTGVAGLVYPGDRVDVLLTHEAGVKGKEGERETEAKIRVSETILNNVRVIAIDQVLEDLKAKGGGRAPKTVTLEVSPRQAEIIAVAVRMGTLTLTLRSLACAGSTTAAAGETPSCADEGNGDNAARGKTYTAESDVSRVSGRAGGPTNEIFVLRGNNSGEKSGNEGVTVRLPPGSVVPGKSGK